MSPIHSATPSTLDPVRQGVEYPPWRQALEQLVEGLIGPFWPSGAENGSVEFPVSVVLDPSSGRMRLAFLESAGSFVTQFGAGAAA